MQCEELLESGCSLGCSQAARHVFVALSSHCTGHGGLASLQVPGTSVRSVSTRTVSDPLSDRVRVSYNVPQGVSRVSRVSYMYIGPPHCTKPQ